MKQLHVEASTYCNARCPLCPRSLYGYKVEGEYFVAPVYNYLIADGLTIKKVEMDSFTAFGTPVEYEFTKTRLQPRSQVIGLTSDHSGRVLLRGFSDYLTDCGIPYLDFSHSKKTDSLVGSGM